MAAFCRVLICRRKDSLACYPPREDPNLSTPAPASMKVLFASLMEALMARILRWNSPASRERDDKVADDFAQREHLRPLTSDRIGVL